MIEIFKKISEHQIRGVMMHRNLMIAYDFLGIRGFKRLNEHQMFSEMAENDGINRYIINHHNHIIIENNLTSPFEIPTNWQGVDRLNVGNSDRVNYWRRMFTVWHEWEKDTKALYQQSYKELCDIGEIAAACKIKDLICDVDMELKEAERLYIKLSEINWDIATWITTCDDCMHDKYAKKTKEIGIYIC